MGTCTRITTRDLRRGDVLLSCGSGWLSEAIVKISGGQYSHAGLWDGELSIDARKTGVARSPLEEVVNEQRFVDAYRWRRLPPEQLRLDDPNYPSAPVIREAQAIVDAGTKFAYDELLMAGLVVAVSGIPANLALQTAARIIAALLDHWVHEHLGGGRQSMMCTEVVCTSFWEADPDRRYAIYVDLAGQRAATLLAATRHAPLPDGRSLAELTDGTDAAYLAAQRECARLVLEATGDRRAAIVAAVGAPAPAVAAGGTFEAAAGSAIAPLGCIPPHELEHSRNLELIGRLG